jgi:hypothetical protein
MPGLAAARNGPWQPEHVQGFASAPGPGVLPPARLHDDELLGLHSAKLEESVALSVGESQRDSVSLMRWGPYE